MAYDLATVTSQGNKLLASVVSDKSSLVIDKIEVSGTQLASSTDLKSMKSISNVVKTLSANGYQKKDTSFIISTVLDNSSVTADYKAWVFGIWAHEADGGSPILMSVITSTSSPDTISKGSGTPIDYNYKFITTFSNTSSLTIQMASDTYATNDTVLHNSGDETATGTKTFQEIKISNDKFPSLVQTDGQYITLDGGNSEMLPVTDNKDGTEQLNGVQVQPYNKLSDTIGGRNVLLGTQVDNVISSDTNNKWNFDILHPTTLVPGKVYTISAEVTLTGSSDSLASIHVNGPDSNTTIVGTDSFPDDGNRHSWSFTCPTSTTIFGIMIYAGVTGHTAGIGATWHHIKIEQGSIATDWTPAPEDKVNVSDMRKPASDVAGIEEVNAKQDKIGYTPADDSKVAHLSGANNFDTVPTVNNNPLLLASSLPSDLARTGSDQEFTGKNTFDTAPIDKTTGNPYITKDGVPSLPSDLARTGQPQTFTAAQTFSIAPTIKDASKDKGDNQAATMADLKSVEEDAWHQLKNGVYLGGTLLYKIDQSSKTIYMLYALNWSDSIDDYTTIADFSSIVKNIKTISGQIYKYQANSMSESIIDLSIDRPASIMSGKIGLYGDGHIGFTDGTYFTYDSLVNS